MVKKENDVIVANWFDQSHAAQAMARHDNQPLTDERRQLLKRFMTDKSGLSDAVSQLFEEKVVEFLDWEKEGV